MGRRNMSKRFFALLLMAVLVLSMGSAQATTGQMSGTEQTEQGADVSVQTLSAANAAGDDAPVGEDGGAADETNGTGENDAFADETNGTGEDNALADGTNETGEDGGAVNEIGETGESGADGTLADGINGTGEESGAVNETGEAGETGRDDALADGTNGTGESDAFADGTNGIGEDGVDGTLADETDGNSADGVVVNEMRETGETGGDDALADGTDEIGADDVLADETNEIGEDGEAADEIGGNGEDAGEAMPAAINNVPVHDEPQTAANGLSFVSIWFEGAEHITALTADSGDVLPDATSGTPIVLSADSEGRVTLDIELEEHYNVEASEECSYDGEKLCLQADTDENGELLPLTERTVKIVPVPTLEVTFSGAPDRIIRLLDPSGTDVTAVAQAGGAITVERTSSDEPVRLALELEGGYTAAADENAFDNVCFGDRAVEIQDDGDGKAVVQVMERPQVMAISNSKLTVIFEGADQITSVTDAASNTPYNFNAPVVLEPVDADGVFFLRINVEDGYYVQETNECKSKTYYPEGGAPSVKGFQLQDRDSDGIVTVRILKLVTVTLVDGDGFVTWIHDSDGSHYGESVDSLTGFYQIQQDEQFELTAKACALDVVGGFVSGKNYSVDGVTDNLSVRYTVKSDGSGDMTITTKTDDSAQIPEPIEIVYVDSENRITSKDRNRYVLPGHSFFVELQDDYMISVEGSVSILTDEDGYIVSVNEDATFVKVTVAAAHQGATLSATIPDAVELTDPYEGKLSYYVGGRTYVGHGGTMTNGKGWFLLKNGYEVGSGVTGGSVSLKQVARDKETRSIYSYYTVDATADTVTVPIVEAQPYRWVKVKVDDAVGCNYKIKNVLVREWDTETTGGEADCEVLLLVLDELTATVDQGYELEAVSGCTLRWEKDEYGKLTYRIIPDAAGDTEVAVRVIEAGDQPPVLKVETDADADVQMDEKAKSKLEDAVGDAIETLAGGGVPVGMSLETAEKFRAALEEADAVTVPEVSAVLRVKEADTASVPGAVAVYEIGIVISVNGEEVGSLTGLAQTVSIGLPLPPETGRIVYVVRSHEGEQEQLPASVQDGIIRFATDRFSEFAIMSSNDLADAAVDPIPDQTWTGSELKPKVCVTITGSSGEEVLKEGVDYELVYRDNVEAGTATVTIMGMGDFVGSSATATFRILATETSGGTTPPSGPDSTADVPETSAPAADIPETSAPAADIPETSAPAADIPETSAPAADVPETSAPAADVPETDAPAADIPETDAPAADVPETSAPAVDAPVTGDETPLVLYAVLLALSMSSLAAILLRRKRQQ